jgi:hypothetical protein
MENSPHNSTSPNEENDDFVLQSDVKSSPIKIQIIKRTDTDSEREPNKKTQYDSTSLITSSSDESESSRQLKKRYDIDYHQFTRSKSTSFLFKHKASGAFPTVKEENPEEDIDNPIEEKKKARFKQLNEAILDEGYDNIEELLSEHRPKKFTKSSKALSVMDPVVEVKEDIDFNSLKIAPFKKLKCLMDFEEDSKFGGHCPSLHYSNRYNMDEAIEEDNHENDIEVEKNKKKKSYTDSMKRVAEFVDLSDKIEEQSAPKNIITEEIEEDAEHEEILEEIITNEKRKLYITMHICE